MSDGKGRSRIEAVLNRSIFDIGAIKRVVDAVYNESDDPGEGGYGMKEIAKLSYDKAYIVDGGYTDFDFVARDLYNAVYSACTIDDFHKLSVMFGFSASMMGNSVRMRNMYRFATAGFNVGYTAVVFSNTTDNNDDSSEAVQNGFRLANDLESGFGVTYGADLDELSSMMGNISYAESCDIDIIVYANAPLETTGTKMIDVYPLPEESDDEDNP